MEKAVQLDRTYHKVSMVRRRPATDDGFIKVEDIQIYL